MEKPPELDPSTQFRELYEREYRSVYRTVRSMVFDPTLAEDLSQEAFVRAYRSRDKYRPTGPAGAWLHRIAVNVTISHLRREKIARIIGPKLLVGPGSGGYERIEAKTLLEKGLARLSPKSGPRWCSTTSTATHATRWGRSSGSPRARSPRGSPRRWW